MVLQNVADGLLGVGTLQEQVVVVGALRHGRVENCCCCPTHRTYILCMYVCSTSSFEQVQDAKIRCGGACARIIDMSVQELKRKISAVKVQQQHAKRTGCWTGHPTAQHLEEEGAAIRKLEELARPPHDAVDRSSGQGSRCGLRYGHCALEHLRAGACCTVGERSAVAAGCRCCHREVERACGKREVEK